MGHFHRIHPWQISGEQGEIQALIEKRVESRLAVSDMLDLVALLFENFGDHPCEGAIVFREKDAAAFRPLQIRRWVMHHGLASCDLGEARRFPHKGGEFCRRHRLAEQIALNFVAAFVAKPSQLLLGFDALGDDRDIQTVA